MVITFATKKLKKQLNESKVMIKVHGPNRTQKLKVVLASLHAASSLGVLAPPYSPLNRCHELTGKLKGFLSVDLDHPYRLLFKPINDPIPMRDEGGLDWSKVTEIQIQGVEDTHG